MSDERRLVISTDPSFTPDDISRRTFGTAFRGWDPNEVKAYLAKVGKELATAQQRVKQLERELRDLTSRANHPELDEATITSALGEEAARILRTAREAASDIKGRAEENAERALRQGQDEAKRIRSEAEGMLADRMKEADDAAEVLRQAAEAEGQRIIEESKAHSREMLHEAQALRAKVLGDLSRRRKLAQVQVAQLRAGRERLLDAYRTVRRTLDEVSDELQRADAEARLAAEQAAMRASDLPEASVDELSAGLTAAMPPALEEAPPPDFEAEAEVAASAPEVAPEPAPAPAEPVPPPAATTPPPSRQLTKAQRKAEKRAERQREARQAAAKPAPPPLPAKPAEPAAEGERTSSSLRVLRGPKPAPTVTTPSGAELEVVEASADIETVRVIPPDPAEPKEKEEEQAAEAPKEPAAEAAPEPEPIPEPEPEPAAEPEPEAAAEPESEPAAEAESEPEAASSPEPEPAAQPVDDLFARLRADRAEAVAKAQQVLQEATAPAAAPESPERESAVASFDDGHLRRRDGELQPVEATLARRLKRGLQDDQNEVLDRLRSHRGPITVDAILPPVDEHAGRFKQVGRDLLVQAARAGASFAGKGGTPPADLTDLVDALADAVIAPLRGRLERGLSGALADGDDEAVLVERIGAAYREWKSQRIEQLAGDQVVAAFGRGLMSATEPGTPLRWIVRDVGGPCPDCDDNALAGAVPSGDTWPTGQVHPPAHPGCRCLLVPAPH
ncbi:MAG TPA: DivIVA domain-containing protein [Acidimicrobiales bacterium]|nr:DivIVA domain-containing protein [Acidimicrobiales bacterium]